MELHNSGTIISLVKSKGSYLQVAACVILFSFAMHSCSTTKMASADGGKQIFHQESADWTTTGDADWVISNGVISATGVLGYAVTTSEYDNFVIEAEFKPDALINSGIFIRCNEDNFSATECYEINIADNHENQKFRTGAIVTKQDPLAIINSVDKWNKFVISANKDHIQVWLNGVKTGDVKDKTSASGKIGLQLNGKGNIQFRNVRIRRL